MAFQYVPGALSHLYQSMSPAERAPINQQVDEAFRKKTGISRKLDWNKPQDKPHARVWLTIRDLVVAKNQIAKLQRRMADLSAQHEARIRQFAKEQARLLASGAARNGLPANFQEPLTGTLLETAHAAAEAMEFSECTGIWEYMLGELSATDVTATNAVLGPLTNLLGGLYAIGHAHEAGERGAERNAFKWGFAAILAAMAEGRDWNGDLPGGTELAIQQARGRNAAIRMVRAMGPEVGREFVKRYQGYNGKATALADLGGYD